TTSRPPRGPNGPGSRRHFAGEDDLTASQRPPRGLPEAFQRAKKPPPLRGDGPRGHAASAVLTPRAAVRVAVRLAQGGVSGSGGATPREARAQAAKLSATAEGVVTTILGVSYGWSATIRSIAGSKRSATVSIRTNASVSSQISPFHQ